MWTTYTVILITSPSLEEHYEHIQIVLMKFMEHQKSFEDAKSGFLQEMTIAFPDFKQPFYLNTDASTVPIGRELFWIVNESRHILEFASRNPIHHHRTGSIGTFLFGLLVNNCGGHAIIVVHLI